MHPLYLTPQFVADQLNQPFPEWTAFPEEHFVRLAQLHAQGEPHFGGTFTGKIAYILGCSDPTEWPQYDALLSEWLGDAYIGMNAVEHRHILDQEQIRQELAQAHDWEEVDQRMREHFMAASQAFVHLLKASEDDERQSA